MFRYFQCKHFTYQQHHHGPNYSEKLVFQVQGFFLKYYIEFKKHHQTINNKLCKILSICHWNSFKILIVVWWCLKTHNRGNTQNCMGLHIYLFMCLRVYNAGISSSSNALCFRDKSKQIDKFIALDFSLIRFSWRQAITISFKHNINCKV